MTMREEIEAELESIRGIRIDKFAECAGIITEMSMTIAVIEPSVPLPPFPEPESKMCGLFWYALAFAGWCALLIWVKG
jgi:hypothetical protein